MNTFLAINLQNYRIKFAIGLFVTGLVLGSSSVQATIIGTGEPSIAACCFGNETDITLPDGRHGRTNIRTVGQTFSIPSTAESILNFSFWLQDFNSEGAGLNFNAYLMDWNAGTTLGPVLYESTTQFGSTSSSLQKYTFEITGGLSITGDEDYVIFISSMDYLAGTSRNAFGSFDFGTDAFSGGNGVVFSGGGIQDGTFSDILNCTANCWVPLSPYLDMAFEVEYADAFSVPEPSIIWLLSSGLALLGFARRRTT